MSEHAPTPSLWARAIADHAFREALIDDPLRALATFDHVSATPEQIRQLEDLSSQDRREVITAILRRAHIEGGAARFGQIGPDGRIGG
jgi:F0F1-type ATP synthase delta subunit